MSADHQSLGTVIVCGCGHGGLATIRSLGRRGVHVVAITPNPDEAALRSRYVDEWELCPHPQEATAFVDYLMERAERWSGALIIETNDYFTAALTAARERLQEHYRLVVAEPDVVETFLEKDRTYALAERCGVPYPKLFEPTSPDDLESIIDQIAYPVMVKPVRSHEFVARFGTKQFIAEDDEQLREAFGRSFEAGLPVVVSEIIPGDDYRTLERLWIYVGTTGEIHVAVDNVKLRQTPPMFGISRAVVTTEFNEELRAHATRLLDASGLRGTAGFEFKRDPRDGGLKLIEVNIRIMADMQMFISAGVDIPWIMYQDHVLGTRQPPPDYRVGQFWIFLIPDVYRFVRNRDPRSVRAFLEPYLSRRRAYAWWSWRDPLPFAAEVKRRLLKRTSSSV